MFQHQDFKDLIEFCNILKPIGGSDENEIKIVEQIHVLCDQKYNTRSKRTALIKNIADEKEFDNNSLPRILQNIRDKIGLKEWILSGYSQVEQDIRFHATLTNEEKKIIRKLKKINLSQMY